MIDPVITLDEADKWEKLWSELFRKGQKAQKEGGWRTIPREPPCFCLNF